MYGTRISLTIGLVGVTMSLVLGVVLGGLSGFYGGIADTLIQRIIEILRSIPTIPLWMGLAAALPRDWSILQVYFAITIIISLLGWTELARVVRGRFLALREEDFVVSARLVGCSQMRTIFVHMVPSFMSHIIAATTLALPAMIISETALSFLGLGLRPPAISWGVLLQQAQNVQTVAHLPVADAPGGARDHRGHGLQLPRRRPAGCRRSLWPLSPSSRRARRRPRRRLLSVRDLKTYFPQDEGTVKAVDGVSFDLYPGGDARHRGRERLRQERHRPLDPAASSIARAGSSRARSSSAGGPPGRRSATRWWTWRSCAPNGQEMRAIRGAEIALIFQEPMSSFSPVHTVGQPDRRGDPAPPAGQPAARRAPRRSRCCGGSACRRRSSGSTSSPTS